MSIINLEKVAMEALKHKEDLKKELKTMQEELNVMISKGVPNF